MAQDPKNYRDPKVTTEPRAGNDTMRWVWIAAAIIVVLLFLAWIFGWFGRDAAVTTTTTPPEATQPAAEGTGRTGGTGAAPSTAPVDQGSTAPAPAPTDGTAPTPAPTDGTTPAPAPTDGTTPAPAPAD